MLLQPDKSYFILPMTKEVGAHGNRNQWTIIKNIEVNNKNKNKNSTLKNILFIWYFKRKIFLSGKLRKHKSRVVAHEGMQKCWVNHWENYSPVVNWINVGSILAIASIHEFPTRSMDLVLAFPQSELDVDVFMDLPLGW